jgi:predicted nuclease with TOPRIM domain
MDRDTKQLVLGALQTLVKTLNENNTYLYKRLDDLDNKLERLNSNLSFVKKDTNLLPSMFKILENDGDDIAEIKIELNKKQNKSDFI